MVAKIQPSFAAGELSPELLGRVDLAKYVIGCSTEKNFFVNYRGGALSRPGTKLVGTSGQPGTALPPRLIRFQFSNTQGYVLEFGEAYMRVIFQGGYVLDGSGNILTVVSPYPAFALPALKFTQSADVMSFTHPTFPPYDLKRLSSTNWVFAATSFGTTLAAPATLTAVPTVTTTGTVTQYAYVVTSIDAVTGEESVASPVATVTNSVDISSTAGSASLNWAPVAGAATYNVYKAPPSYGTAVPIGSLFGFAGTSYGTQFVDTNITQDLSQVPPLHKNPFSPGQVIAVTITGIGSGADATTTVVVSSASGAGAVLVPVVVAGGVVAVIVQNPGSNYTNADTLVFAGAGSGFSGTIQIGPQSGTFPSCVAYFQQRRVYANTNNQPDTYFMSQPGAFTNFDSRVPSSDSDAIIGTPWSQQVNGIQFLVPMPGGLVVLTGSGAWQLTGAGGSSISPQAITPTNQQAQPQAYNGCSSTVPPLTINYDILYVQAKGSSARDLNYNFYLNIYTGTDLTLFSSHLFTDHTILEWAWAEEPYKVVWAVRDDGILLCLTYLKEQEITGWTRHETQGTFVSVCTVTEPPVDAPYFVVKRTIAGVPKYFVERMDDRIWDNVADAWCVDCALSYSGTPITTVTGLDHLDGMVVTGLADGQVIVPQTVVNGSITLPVAASTITVGLGYTCQLQTMYLEAGQGAPTVQGRRKNVNSVVVRVNASRGLEVGTNQVDDSTTPTGTAPPWTNATGMIQIKERNNSIAATAAVPLYTGDYYVNVPGDWKRPGQVAIQQEFPLPAELLAIVSFVSSGDDP